MPLRLYHDPLLTTKVREIVGYLEGNGVANTFITYANPTIVRLYAVGKSYGEIIDNYIVSANGDGTYTVLLDTPPQVGEVVVAFDDGVDIFADYYTIGNSQDELDRTITDRFWLYADNVNAHHITISIGDFVPYSGAMANWFYLAPDNNGVPGTFTQDALYLGSLYSGEKVPFWIKVVVAYGSGIGNFRDIYLNIDALLEAPV